MCGTAASRSAADEITIPSTCLSSRTSIASFSRASFSSVFSTIASYPCAFIVSEMPRSTELKNGLATSARTTPMVWVVPVVMLRAMALGRYPRRSAASMTRARVLGLTEP